MSPFSVMPPTKVIGFSIGTFLLPILNFPLLMTDLVHPVTDGFSLALGQPVNCPYPGAGVSAWANGATANAITATPAAAASALRSRFISSPLHWFISMIQANRIAVSLAD